MSRQKNFFGGGTYSLLISDVQLGLDVRLQVVVFESGIDPSILHDLLHQTKRVQMFFFSISVDDVQFQMCPPRDQLRSPLFVLASRRLDQCLGEIFFF